MRAKNARSENPLAALKVAARAQADAIPMIEAQMQMYRELQEWAMEEWWKLCDKREQLRAGVSDTLELARLGEQAERLE